MLSYRRFSEASASDFILLNFGEKAAKAFELCHHAAMKSDYFRLSYLYKNGGVYVDADDRCLKPIDPIIANLATTNLIASVTDDFPGYVHNWFLAANPGSQVLGMALAQATNDIIDSEGRTPRPDIWQTTGPGLITRCIAAVCARSGINVDKEVRLMTLAQYRNFVQEQLSLSYKNSVEGNWRNA
jgi:mannosyltransferase OCH1-like enzyme